RGEGDTAWHRWQSQGGGIYATNGVVAALILKSQPSYPEPDLFVFGLPGDFHGYFRGYSGATFQGAARRCWTWVILKAHSRNHCGHVRLADHRSWIPPDIEFASFSAKCDPDGTDLRDLLFGVEAVRALMKRVSIPGMREVRPGASVQGSELADLVRHAAW